MILMSNIFKYANEMKETVKLHMHIPVKYRNIRVIKWHFHLSKNFPFGLLKLNTDGSSKGSQGAAGCGEPSEIKEVI